MFRKASSRGGRSKGIRRTFSPRELQESLNSILNRRFQGVSEVLEGAKGGYNVCC